MLSAGISISGRGTGILCLIIFAYLSNPAVSSSRSPNDTQHNGDIDTSTPATAPEQPSCDTSLPLRSALYITPTDAPDSHYGINFGTFSTTPDSSTTVKILQERQIDFQVVEVRDLACRRYYVLMHGQFASVKKAENEMWRLLSFPNPAPFSQTTLVASVAKIPPPQKKP